MEIERKFLVDKAKWAKVNKSIPQRIVQAYLVRTIEKTIRVRVKGKKGFLTIKGPTIGITRSEFEYEIPLNEADELIEQFADKIIEKHRYEITVGNHLWEVDEFHGKLEGLMLAEIELTSENEEFEIPDWVTEDVSIDEQYFNSNLVERC
jgi:CYTH domain-containing protein